MKKGNRKNLESLIDSVIDPIATTDKRGILTFLNEEAEELLGYKSEELIGKHVSICYKKGKEEAKRIMSALEKDGKMRNYEITYVCKDGREILSLLSASFLRNSDGEIIGSLGISKDISERKMLEDELNETKEFLENVVESSIDAIVTTDKKGNLTFLNNAASTMMGIEKELIHNCHLSEYYEGGIEEARNVNSILKEKGTIHNYETMVKGKGGELIPVSSSISLLKDGEGNVVGTLGVIKDITERKKMEEELYKLSITDSLTGLYNQRHFYDELKKEIERAKRQNRALSLLLFDIDGFKHYNDTYGHLEGDKILHEVGKIVIKNIRDNVDSGHRYGGDEFIIILPETDRDQAFSVAKRISETFNETELVNVTISIGLVEYHREYDLETFIRYADEAMYEAKHLGGNKIKIYD